MSTRNCYWLCLLTLGVLAASLGVQAAPREGATGRGKDAGRPDSLRVLTGSDAQLRTNLDEGSAAAGCIIFDTVPVPPYAGGGGGYSAANISGHTLELPGGTSQRIWLELRISNWACTGGPMGTWQAYYGPDFNLPAGITRPVQPCATAADCDAAGMGCDFPGCAASCNVGQCDPGFQQQAAEQPTALNFDIEACATVRIACGGTQVATPAVVDTGTPRYAMTVVLEVSPSFVGAADVNVQDANTNTFFQDENGAQIPIGKTIPATIVVPSGSCCAFAPLFESCVEDVPIGSCPSSGLWREGVACPLNGGPDCCECVVNVDCEDSVGSCTTNQCENCVCVTTLIPGYVPGGPNCCNPVNGQLVPRDDADPCTSDTCSVDDASSLGTPQHGPASDGTGCDDDNPCTADDQCMAGECTGHAVNGDPCATDADCQNGGETPGAVCVDGACEACADAIPATSTWGLVLLTLLLAVVGKISFATATRVTRKRTV